MHTHLWLFRGQSGGCFTRISVTSTGHSVASANPKPSCQRVIEVVRANGEVSRRKISTETGLSTPSVTRLVGELTEAGFLSVLDSTTAEGSGPGRPASVVKFNPDCGCNIGVDIGEHMIQFALSDMAGQVHGQTNIATEGKRGSEVTCDGIVQGIEELWGAYQSRFNENVPPLRAITVGVPGTVCPVSSRVVKAPMIQGWSDFNLKSRLEKRLPKVALRIENDINAAAIGEYAYGVAKGLDNFVFASIRKGIGAGIFIDGKLYRGNSGFAGEMGKMAFDNAFAFSPTDGTGHLESICGEDPVIRMATQKGIALESEESGSPTMNSLAMAAANGVPEANEILKSVLSLYGLAIANVASLLDPTVIVLGGDIHPVMDMAVEYLNETVAKLIPSPPKVVGSSLGAQVVLKGTLCLAHKDACDRLLLPELVLDS